MSMWFNCLQISGSRFLSVLHLWLLLVHGFMKFYRTISSRSLSQGKIIECFASKVWTHFRLHRIHLVVYQQFWLLQLFAAAESLFNNLNLNISVVQLDFRLMWARDHINYMPWNMKCFIKYYLSCLMPYCMGIVNGNSQKRVHIDSCPGSWQLLAFI